MAKILTTEEKKTQMEELKTKAESLCTEYNDADSYYMDLAAGETPEGEEPRKLNLIRKDLDEAIKKYKDLSLEVLHDECRASANPMLELVKRLTYPTISAQAKKPDGVPDADYTVLKIADGTAYADIVAFGNALKTGFQWFPRMQKIARALHDSLAKSTNAQTGEYIMSDAAKEIDFGKDLGKLKNTDSINAFLVEVFQQIANAMFGDGIVTVEPRDAAWISNSCSSAGKGKHGTRFQGDQEFALTMARAFNRAITGASYVMECKNYKK